MEGHMRAMLVETPRPAEEEPLRLVERQVREPGADEVRIRVEVCGVCRTDLHVAEGDLEPRRPSVIPGHEIVGIVDACGREAQRFREGDRVGVAWLHRASKARVYVLHAVLRQFLRRRNAQVAGRDDDVGVHVVAVFPDRSGRRSGVGGGRVHRRAGGGDELMAEKLRGRVWKYGDNVDTDAIIPARYLNVSTAEELAAHCMQDVDATFASQVQTGDIVVGGTNFGCGSSREHAPLALKGSGVSCVVAESFARIFYRNSINIGLPILIAPEAVDGIEDGDEIEVDPSSGIIGNLSRGGSWQSAPFPPEVREIIDAGGLVGYVRGRIGL